MIEKVLRKNKISIFSFATVVLLFEFAAIWVAIHYNEFHSRIISIPLIGVVGICLLVAFAILIDWLFEKYSVGNRLDVWLSKKRNENQEN